MRSNRLSSRWQSENYSASVDSVLKSIKLDRRYSGAADLRGLIVGLDGQLPDLGTLDFQDSELSGVDFGYGRFSCSFSRCSFTDCSLDHANFDTCRMASSRFSRTSFVSVSISAPMLDDAVFEDCNFSDAKFRGRGMKMYGGRRAKFRSCSFDRVQFVGVELRACRFENCSFEGTVFQRCLLAGVKFEGPAPNDDQFQQCGPHGAGADI